MKSKKSFFLMAAVFVLLFCGAYLLYNKLGDQLQMPGLVTPGGSGEDAEIASEEAAEGTGTGADEADQTQVSGDGAATEANDSGTADGASSAEGENAEDSDEVLTPAPDFTVYDAEGNAYKLSDFRGKPVILNFWASWCGPCKSEMPDFEEVYLEYGEEIHFLMVNLTDGYQETVESAKEFIEESGYTFPVYYDTASEAAYVYGVYSIPTTYFIDAEGYAVAYGSGALNLEVIKTGIGMMTGE